MNDELRRRLADITDYYSVAEHKVSSLVGQVVRWLVSHHGSLLPTLVRS